MAADLEESRAHGSPAQHPVSGCTTGPGAALPREHHEEAPRALLAARPRAALRAKVSGKLRPGREEVLAADWTRGFCRVASLIGREARGVGRRCGGDPAPAPASLAGPGPASARLGSAGAGNVTPGRTRTRAPPRPHASLSHTHTRAHPRRSRKHAHTCSPTPTRARTAPRARSPAHAHARARAAPGSPPGPSPRAPRDGGAPGRGALPAPPPLLGSAWGPRAGDGPGWPAAAPPGVRRGRDGR